MSKQENLFGWADFNPPRYSPRNTPRRLAANRATGERRRGKLEGQHFGKWTVVGHIPRYQTKHNQIWLCRCQCGRTQRLATSQLTKGHSRGCPRCNIERAAVRIEPYRALYNSVRLHAQREGHEFALSFEEFLDFVEIDFCCYCFSRVRWSKHYLAKNGRASNLDRKNNALGYSFGNVVVCCRSCNIAKGNRYSYRLWIQMTAPLRQIRICEYMASSEPEPEFKTFWADWVRQIKAEFSDMTNDWTLIGPDDRIME